MMEALLRHRAASIDYGATAVPWSLPDRSANPKRLFHWDPWVRSYLTAQELIQAFDFKLGQVPWHGTQLPSVTLRATSSRDGSLGGSPQALVTLVAPPIGVFEQQVDQVLDWAELREERVPEILAQIDNQHNFWGMLIPVQTDRLKRTRELLEAAVRVAVFVEMRFKHSLACWRPIDYSPQVQPIIDTPGHGALPSGHCTESYVIYEVLMALLNSSTETKADEGRRSLNRQFRYLAERIAMNRVIAGVHFPVDNVAGRMLGVTLGRYIAHRFSAGKTIDLYAATFDGRKFSGSDVFDPTNQRVAKHDEDCAVEGDTKFYSWSKQALKPFDDPASDILDPLWQAAMSEVVELGLRFA